jgi:hypothetical protein
MPSAVMPFGALNCGTSLNFLADLELWAIKFGVFIQIAFCVLMCFKETDKKSIYILGKRGRY